MIIPIDYAQANLRFTGVAAPNGSEITLGLDISAFGGSTPQDVADDVADAWTATMHTELSLELTLTEVYVKFGPNDVGASGSVARAVVGGNAAASVPPNTGILARKNTTIGGRRGRGRMYIPGCPEAHVSGSGLLTTSSLNAFQVEMDAFYLALTTAVLTPVVLHSAGISSTPVPTEVTGFAVAQLMGTQRDRMRP